MSELEQKIFQKRQIAFKVSILDILNGMNISRVNIVATLIYKSEDLNYDSAIIDDGGGRILVRGFEKSNIFSNVDVGDVVLVVGKIRDFNNERYIIPEILKKVEDAGWMNVRKLELRKSSVVIEDTTKDKNGGLIEDIKLDNHAEVYDLIKKLDEGDGVPIDDAIKNSKICDAEEIISRLLEKGDIFEVKPGKLKILE